MLSPLCLCRPVYVRVSLYLSVSDSSCFCLSVYVSVCVCPCLSVSVCVSPSVHICDCLCLSVSVPDCLSSCFSLVLRRPCYEVSPVQIFMKFYLKFNGHVFFLSVCLSFSPPPPPFFSSSFFLLLLQSGEVLSVAG